MHGCRRPPPDMPAPGIEPTTLRLRDLRLARLSEPGILCVCVCVCSLAPQVEHHPCGRSQSGTMIIGNHPMTSTFMTLPFGVPQDGIGIAMF